MAETKDVFHDPLENYEPHESTGRLEHALVDESVKSIAKHPFASLHKSTPVRKAIEVLSGLDVACIMIEDENGLVGIFSEWDVLHNVAFEVDDEKLDTTPIEAVMTRDPYYVLDSDPVSAALAAMANCGCRHIPVLDVDSRIVGIISPYRLMTYLEQQTSTSSE